MNNLKTSAKQSYEASHYTTHITTKWNGGTNEPSTDTMYKMHAIIC